MKYAVAFARFWYDFIVGDSAVLAAGGVCLLALGWALVEAGASDLAEVVLPLVVMTTILVSLPLRHSR